MSSVGFYVDLTLQVQLLCISLFPLHCLITNASVFDIFRRFTRETGFCSFNSLYQFVLIGSLHFLIFFIWFHKSVFRMLLTPGAILQEITSEIKIRIFGDVQYRFEFRWPELSIYEGFLATAGFRDVTDM